MIKLVYVRTYKSGQFVLLRSVNKSMKPSGALEFSWQGPHQVVDRGVVRQYVANSNITMCLATGGLYKQTMFVSVKAKTWNFVRPMVLKEEGPALHVVDVSKLTNAC